jgi:Xaa-Pro aminopeptidase
MQSPKLTAIRKAQAITDQVFTEIKPSLKAGMSEKKLAAEIERRGFALGASKLAFPVMVGSGPKGAAIHAFPGPRKFKRGDVVVIDYGFVVNGYHSDMTRTISIGRPTKRAQEVYDIVLKAHKAALRNVRAGITCQKLDAKARGIITQAGYGNRFGHALGHGVGRKIHQEPKISPRRRTRLKVGDVVTIEPGIYLPREFGVRIEDMVLVTATGYENLTRTPKRLIV